jgi:capsule biosynthesis phosphatase
MRICIDLDGVICELKKEGQTYDQLAPVAGAIEKLNQLKAAGHYIIIQTARHMKTCDGNVGRVQARIGAATLNWLEKNKVPYDEIYFGKPWAQIYIDDNAFRFEKWETISGDGSSFPSNREETFLADGK